MWKSFAPTRNSELVPISMILPDNFTMYILKPWVDVLICGVSVIDGSVLDISYQVFPEWTFQCKIKVRLSVTISPSSTEMTVYTAQCFCNCL